METNLKRKYRPVAFAKRLLLAMLLLMGVVYFTRAQVTIGSGLPPGAGSLLDLKEKSPADPAADNSTADRGINLPRVRLASITDLFPMFESDGEGGYKIGSQIYIKADEDKSHTGLVVYNVDNTFPEGIYYWNGANWIEIATDSIWLSSRSGFSNQPRTYGISRCEDNVYHLGQVAIGADQIDPAAILNVNAPDKGVLLPRVKLASATDIVTIPNPATGLLVYNTGEGLLKTEGYLHWNGTEWVQFATSPSKNPAISALDCVNARIVPSRFVQGEQYEGVLIVPYTGGNGGRYASGTPIASTGVTGLTATLQPNNLAYGNGDLVFSLSGVPSQSSPQLATFDISFLGNNCQAIVGANSIMQGEIVFWHGSMPANVFGEKNKASDLIGNMPVIEDVLMLDAYFNVSATTYPFIPRIYNISEKPVKFWWGGVTSVEGRGRSNVVLHPKFRQNLDNGMFMGLGENMREGESTRGKDLDEGATSQETMTIDLFYNKRWYRIFFTGWADNHNTKGTEDDTREIYITYQRMY